MPRKILLLNDDGYVTRAFPLTYEALTEVDYSEVLAVVPEIPKSASAHAVTLHKPLFLKRIYISDMNVYVINGTPADAFHAAISILNFKPDIVVSGVNVGENTSSQNILYSGTIAAAIEAGLFGYPSVAFSADVTSDSEFMDREYAELVKSVIKEVVRFILSNGWFESIDAISINIPRIRKPLGAVIAKPQRIRFIQHFERRVDPRGRPYYWLVGKKVTERGTDSYYLEEGYVVITPLKSDLAHPALTGCPPIPAKLHKLVDTLNDVLKD